MRADRELTWRVVALLCALSPPQVFAGSDEVDDAAPSVALLEFLGSLVQVEEELLGPDQADALPDPDFLGEARTPEPQQSTGHDVGDGASDVRDGEHRS